MKPSLQKLTKFFSLEAERGYDNRAVMGGLDRMLSSWESEARLDQLSEELIQAVIARLRDYNNLSPKSRAEALEGLWRRIQRESDITLAPLAPIVEKKTSQTGITGGRDPGVESGKEFARIKTEESGKALPAATGNQNPSAAQVFQQPAGSVNDKIQPPMKPSTPHQAIETPPAALNAPTMVLPGVGAKHAQTLNRLGIYTLGDMLYYFPRRYDDYTQLHPINRLFYGEEVTVIGTVQSVVNRPVRSGHVPITEAVINDGSGSLRITWFNQPWIVRRLRNNMQIVLSGKIDQYLGRLVMNNPEWEPLEQQNLNTNRIVPVYPLTANITQRWLRKLMFQVVTYWAPRIQDPLNEAMRRENGLMDLSTSLKQAHFPDSWDLLTASRQRLAFDEIFLLQLGVLSQKRSWQNRSARIFDTPSDWLAERVSKLPYSLTGAQQRALEDVRGDLASGRPMNRLLQGDVGSGKTVIAAMSISMLVRHGAQAALMAPTSILAEQHYQNLLNLLCNIDPDSMQPEKIRLMVGATPEVEKQEIRTGLEQGTIKVVIGTHALIEDPVKFADLQLVIVDEQHRFGVDQRALLRSKGDNPHLLVMTATPIPRSLALTVYGDLDLSVMDEMPPGRQAVETHVLYPRERERAYALVRGQVDQGKQAFIVYPLVEESENSEALAAVKEQERLQAQIFPKHHVGLLHGRMKPEEKDEVMAHFRDGKIHVLASTTVVEVGVDIPNATVMMVEGANRFGLAQLHQLRGRVGRGQDKAYCILIPDTADDMENERLKAMVETNNGFILAERDLEQRGPGEFLGNRQSGYSELKLASLTDVRLIEKARRLSLSLFEIDPELKLPENKYLANALFRFWGGEGTTTKGDIS